jgi:hypothetical protein
LTNTKAKGDREQRVQIKTRQPGPVQPSGFTQLRRHADLNSVDTVAEILSLPTEATSAVDPDQTRTSTRPVPEPYQYQTRTGAVPEGNQSQGVQPPAQVESPAPAQRAGQKTARPKSKAAAAPERDFGRVANSITRDALPAGAFPGSSKKIYDVLYLRTRAAVTPVRSVRAVTHE